MLGPFQPAVLLDTIYAKARAAGYDTAELMIWPVGRDGAEMRNHGFKVRVPQSVQELLSRGRAVAPPSKPDSPPAAAANGSADMNAVVETMAHQQSRTLDQAFSIGQAISGQHQAAAQAEIQALKARNERLLEELTDERRRRNEALAEATERMELRRSTAMTEAEDRIRRLMDSHGETLQRTRRENDEAISAERTRASSRLAAAEAEHSAAVRSRDERIANLTVDNETLRRRLLDAEEAAHRKKIETDAAHRAAIAQIEDAAREREAKMREEILAAKRKADQLTDSAVREDARAAAILAQLSLCTDETQRRMLMGQYAAVTGVSVDVPEKNEFAEMLTPLAQMVMAKFASGGMPNRRARGPRMPPERIASARTENAAAQPELPPTPSEDGETL